MGSSEWHTLKFLGIQFKYSQRIIVVNMDKYQQYAQNSGSNLHEYEYTRNMGAFRPRFQGIPDQYYPLSCCETFMYVVFVISIIGGTLALMIGFLYWVTIKGLPDFTIVWSIIFLAFTLTMVILFYFGGKSRIRQEKRLIAEQQKKQQKMINKDNIKKQRNRPTVEQL